MRAEQRRSRLLDMIRQHKFARLPDLVEQMAVSESTVRRDLEKMESDGRLRRIHGGAMYLDLAPQLPHFDSLQDQSWSLKQAVARKAAELVNDGDVVLLGGGTTVFEVARALVGRPLHIVTTSLPTANLFASDPKSDLIFVGGNICPQTGVARGPYADRTLAAIRVRKTILSVAGICDEGCFNNNLLLVETERVMMRAAEETIIVADSTKFGRQSLAHLCPLNEVGRLVTDDRLAVDHRERLRESGVHLEIAATQNSFSLS